ncbi:MAG: hypothetical protein K6E61_00150 [Bacteroidales bacterium]|nr:hypothetical protein [Bacteroidales bacterium]
MDIDLLAKMVREIMMDHDSVTLPGLGSFAAEVVPATFSDKGYTINPPYRRLYFLPHQGTDTLLADLYSSSNNISASDATRILVEYLTEMKEVLVAKKLIVFPGLGRLRATRENHFFFVADEYLDIYPSGFGLEPISLKTHEETPEEVEQAVSSLAQMLETEPVAEPEPVVEPEPVAEPEPVIEPEPVVEQVPVVKPEPEPKPEPAPVEEAPAPVIPSEAEESPVRRIPIIVSILIWIAAIAVVAIIALAVIGHVAPEWLDYYLYSPEELEILRSL